jgi:hypothetical protein
MDKDHFPVNDKTIADVNKANAAAYDSTPVDDASGFTGSTHSRHGSYHLIEGAGQHSADHVRESSQEHGEQHDAGRSLTSLEQERGTGKAKPRKEDVAKQGVAWKREQERTFAKYGK